MNELTETESDMISEFLVDILVSVRPLQLLLMETRGLCEEVRWKLIVIESRKYKKMALLVPVENGSAVLFK